MSHNCDHHRCDDPANDDYVGVDESEKNLLVATESCTRCRKLSNSSSILSYEVKLRNNWSEDLNVGVDGDEFNENSSVPNIMFPQTRLSVNSADSNEPLMLVRNSRKLNIDHRLLDRSHFRIDILTYRCKTDTFTTYRNIATRRYQRRRILIPGGSSSPLL